MVEIGDLVQDGKVWRDQVMRLTVVTPAGNTEWQLFRGSKSRALAVKWLEGVTSGTIRSF